jgi:hypothetical protein
MFELRKDERQIQKKSSAIAVAAEETRYVVGMQ